jgi:putative glutamine amidotransferase
MESQKPIIGVTPSYDYDKMTAYVRPGYCEGIIEAGGIPLLLPFTTNDSVISEVFDKIDGILLAGGVDIDPFYFQESVMPYNGSISPERDYLELLMAARAIEEKKPVLGICRGCQVLNVAGGGSLFQDIYSQIKDKPMLEHTQKAPAWYGTHEVTIQKDSLLLDILGTESIRTNSFHHQSIKDVADGFIISAVTSDGIIECIEHISHPFCLGLQWHPERMWEKDRIFLKPFERFVEMCML